MRCAELRPVALWESRKNSQQNKIGGRLRPEKWQFAESCSFFFFCTWAVQQDTHKPATEWRQNLPHGASRGIPSAHALRSPSGAKDAAWLVLTPLRGSPARAHIPHPRLAPWAKTFRPFQGLEWFFGGRGQRVPLRSTHGYARCPHRGWVAVMSGWLLVFAARACAVHGLRSVGFYGCEFGSAPAIILRPWPWPWLRRSPPGTGRRRCRLVLGLRSCWRRCPGRRR